jgi:hypothetical protein
MFRPYFTGSVYCSGGCQTKRLRQEDEAGPILSRDGWIHIVNFQNPLIGHGGERSFEECFHASLKQQQESTCPRCKRLTWRTVKDKYVQLPKVFLTQLNRSTNTQGKIQEHCEILRELTVPIEDSVRNEFGNHKYRLAAVVAHSGESSISGHCISYVRDPTRPGGWIELDDNRDRNIDFEEINHNKKPGKEDMLPYIMAWELIDLSEETTAAGGLAEAANGREAALATREKELDEKEATLKTREEELNNKEKALDERERDLDQRERGLQAEKEVDDLFEDTDNGNGSNKSKGSSPEQPGVPARDQLAQEVDKRTDTATFCATFQNVENHDENARAIFKLQNFKPNAATKIESTVQLTDLEGNLRTSKKGTMVNDEFIIIFNVKGGKKRKRGGDDEASPPRPSKKSKGSKKQQNKPRTSPKASEEVQQSPRANTGSPNKEKSTSPKTNPEPKSTKIATETVKASEEQPRRSTRINKGKNPRIY